MRGFLILLVVAIGLVVGDRVGVAMAQDEIASKIATEYHLAQRPSVTIGGIPFLTQAVRGRYDDVEIRAGEWSDQGISVRDLDVTLTGVSAPLGDLLASRTSNLEASTATATALVPYDTVKGYAPSGVESISHSPDGVRVAGTFEVEGIPVPVPATVVVTVNPTADGIEVVPVSVQSAMGGPTISLAWLRQSLTFTVPLQKLPLGARLTAIEPEADGLRVTAVAQDVRFSDLP
ncbi:LmeA family phospholipid-binding protein [Nocardia inohanensis]|uniref:LmeA family phospholipid-binding protein n=1 Tax=Nocardia inohanensis TaxID=209246 RepID=UPI0008360F98|nr:DUF2993 domain-containing protein [Nocardia inohanensis]